MCLLATVCLIYLPFSFVFVNRVKHQLQSIRHRLIASSKTSTENPIHMRSANNLRHHSNNSNNKKTSCQICSEKFPEDNSELSSFFPQGSTIPSASAAQYQREVRFQNEYFLARNGRRCRECTERYYFLLLYFVLSTKFCLKIFRKFVDKVAR